MVIQIRTMEMRLFLNTLDDDEDHVEIDESSDTGNESEVAGKHEKGVNVKITQSKPETVDVSALLPVQPSGKRTHREETQSEEMRVEKEAAKLAPKRTRTGFRESHERRATRYLKEDYVMNVVQSSSRVLGKDNKPIQGNNIRIPKGHREVMRSDLRDYWREAEMQEMAALKAKGIIVEIPCNDVPENAKPINTRWVYAVMSDYQGFVIRFKARIVAFGNHQRPGIDFVETFAPVARISSFRLMVALAAVLDLQLYGGNENAAYLNAKFGIQQYLRSIDGFPCQIDGYNYLVVRALYGLRQSGREWNSELNRWLLAHGYQRSTTERCLYYYDDQVLVRKQIES
ncbi:Copiatype Polyprotein [Phytophthora palmivora]|uniref:Copiatype Polyprotein n=1 Tax=Phytophthora palmivora TaxID=4796 RepID=A0A2P4XQD9_9STRA|nr:Copiatype Polyprotein [Phytophthora palmivora]